MNMLTELLLKVKYIKTRRDSSKDGLSISAYNDNDTLIYAVNSKGTFFGSYDEIWCKLELNPADKYQYIENTLSLYNINDYKTH